MKQLPDHVTPRRLRSAVTGAAILVSMFATPLLAGAADADLSVEQTAWFWSSNQKYTFCTKDPALGACQAFILSDAGPRGIAPVPPGTVSPISYGHMGVSMIQGAPDMRSFIKLDLRGIPEGSAIDSLVLHANMSLPTPTHTQMHADARGHTPGTFNEKFARIDACSMVEPWGPAEGDAPYAYQFQRPMLEEQSTDINLIGNYNEPMADCGRGRARGQITKDGSGIEWDLTRLAQAWVDNPISNEGVTLIGVGEGPVTTWMVELHGMELTLAATGVAVPLPVPVEIPEQDLPPSVYVTAEQAAYGTVKYHAKPAVVEPGPRLIIQPVPGDPIIIIQPGAPEQVFVGLPQAPAQPVYTAPQIPAAAGTGTTPAWVYLAFPLGLLGMGALFGALGNDPLASGAVPLAGSRVAMMLRARRIDS